MHLFLKGFIIGIGKIIPGVSGSLIAIRLNVYEKIIYCINNFFDDYRNNLIYLGKICSGVLLAILLGSKLILYLLNSFYLPTKIIFLILIGTGIPTVLKKTNHYYFSIIAFTIYFGLLYLPSLNIFHSYYFMGFLESFTTIIPGISGTAIFMSLGLYDELLMLFSNFYMFDFAKILPFGIGFFVATIILVHFINYCFKNYLSETYGVILGLLLASLFSMIIKR